MKWLFFLLLLVNIGLFVWIYPQQPPVKPQTALLPGVKRLVLLSETSQATRSSSTTAQAVSPLAGEPEEQVEPAAAKLHDKTLLNGRSSAQGGSPAPGTIPEIPDNLTLHQAAGTQNTGLVENPLAANLSSTVSQENRQNALQSESSRQCRRIGPLDKRSQVDKLSLSLMAMGIQTELQTEAVEEQEGYWVLIPPQKSREAAMAMVKQLREAGISDLWRFSSGALADAISLGLFRNESRAEIRRKALADKGFQAEVRPRYRQKNSYWLDFSFQGQSPLTEADWNHITEIYPGVEQRSVDCVAIRTK